MRKYRLMLITHDLAIGGLQQVVVNLCRTINRELFDVSVLCLRGLGEFTRDVEEIGLKVFSLSRGKTSSDFLQFLRVAKLLRRERIDIVHTHNTHPFIDGTLGALMSGVKTIIHTDHARDFPDKKRYMFLEWIMSHFAYKIVGVSDDTKNNLANYEKIPLRKLVTIANGVDGNKFDIQINKKMKKLELGIPEKGPVIGMGVRLTKQKGITYLLQAMPTIINSYPKISLVIAGEGPLLNDLMEEAAFLRIQEHVHFIGPRKDMAQVLKLFDLYILPSVWEGLPMVIIEAMAAGCPIVATDVGGNSTALTQRENGSLVPPRDSMALASEIIWLLSDSRSRRLYIKKSLNKFHKNFSADIMARKYEQLYLRKSLLN